MSEELRPALSWGDALLRINELTTELEVTKQLAEQRGHSLLDATKRIRELEALCKELKEGSVCLQGAIRLAINDGVPTTNDILAADKIADEAPAKYTALYGNEAKEK